MTALQFEINGNPESPMSRPIIEVSGVSKRYRLGAIGATTIRDETERFFARLRGRAASANKNDFWALRDVSFDVQPGEVVGIVGRNGAGKSTLLKVLSRITEPTSGEIRLRGRVASLLEVGTGFHPELSGRDNIFLNGAILGMRRTEITRKFDEIVAFSEVERFLDTPVKRYSSGMYVRLAFAVAAHLEPEILIVDEVLAVGDQQFQQKCLGKMREVSRGEGRTVLFVSHNMAAVRSLCSNAILLSAGQVVFNGSTTDVVDRYNGLVGSNVGFQPKKEGSRFADAWLETLDGERTSDIPNQTDVNLFLSVHLDGPRDIHVGISLYDANNVNLFSSVVNDSLGVLEQGRSTLRLRIPVGFLRSGNYRVQGSIWSSAGHHDNQDAIAAFHVQNLDFIDRHQVREAGLMRNPEQWRKA
jgi:lipopolysaccharide transport system ATP-binding protein